MFDFISFVRDSGLTVTLSPAAGDDLVVVAVRGNEELEEIHVVTSDEARNATNIDRYIGMVLGQMVAKLGSRKARMYSNMHASNEMKAREDFFRGK